MKRITLLLFIVGLELAPKRLWRMRHEIFGLGLLQVGLCGLAISAVLKYADNIARVYAHAIAMMLTMAVCTTRPVHI